MKSLTEDDYDALSQKHLASIKRDMRVSLEDATVRATHKVMVELEAGQESDFAELEKIMLEVWQPVQGKGQP